MNKIGRIYKISSKNHSLVYIGSTRSTIQQRFYGHCNILNNCSSRELIKCGDATIELIQEVDNIEDKELRLLEQKYMDCNNCINKKNAIYDKLSYDRLYHKNRRRNMKSRWRTL